MGFWNDIEVIDEDTMVSDSPTAVPTQQSVKTYVDAQSAGAPGNVSSIDGQTGAVDLAGDYAAISYGTFVRRIRQTLTGKTSFAGTSAEQWGTEEATLDNAVLPKLTEATVFAQVIGYAENLNTTSSLNINVEISLDGGSTWDTGTSLRLRRNATGGANDYQSIANDHQVVGTVTGDIQARVMATSAQGAADPRDLSGGHLYMEVVIAQIPLA